MGPATCARPNDVPARAASHGSIALTPLPPDTLGAPAPDRGRCERGRNSNEETRAANGSGVRDAVAPRAPVAWMTPDGRGRSHCIVMPIGFRPAGFPGHRTGHVARARSRDSARRRPGVRRCLWCNGRDQTGWGGANRRDVRWVCAARAPAGTPAGGGGCRRRRPRHGRLPCAAPPRVRKHARRLAPREGAGARNAACEVPH